MAAADWWWPIAGSFATTALSECGDRTFIASTVLSLKCKSPWVVSAVVGELLRTHLGGTEIPWTLLLTAAVFGVFAVRYLWEGLAGTRNLKGRPSDLTQHSLALREDLALARPRNGFALFWEIFGLIYVTEIGDTSMVAQTALASQQNFACVFVGGVLANMLVNGVGIFCGDAVGARLDVRLINILAGLLFAGYAVAAGVELLLLNSGLPPNAPSRPS